MRTIDRCHAPAIAINPVRLLAIAAPLTFEFVPQKASDDCRRVLSCESGYTTNRVTKSSLIIFHVLRQDA